MTFLKKLFIIFLILLLAFIALKITLPILAGILKLFLTLSILALVILGIIYLYGKLKSA